MSNGQSEHNWSDLVEAAFAMQVETKPVELSAAYLRAIEKIENLPQNQSGTDKSSKSEALRASREHLRRARRVG